MSTANAVLKVVEARLGVRRLDYSTTPSLEQSLAHLDADIQWVLGMCAERNSELGRTTGTITTVDGTISYSDLASDMFTPATYGWVLDTYSRNPIYLTTEESILGHNPDSSAEAEPTHFYIDASGNVLFLPTPDDEYTVYIPYWQQQTPLTSRSSTMPFGGIFDDILVEALVLRLKAQNQADPSYEYKWLQALSNRAKNLIEMRKNFNSSVTV